VPIGIARSLLQQIIYPRLNVYQFPEMVEFVQVDSMPFNHSVARLEGGSHALQQIMPLKHVAQNTLKGIQNYSVEWFRAEFGASPALSTTSLMVQTKPVSPAINTVQNSTALTTHICIPESSVG